MPLTQEKRLDNNFSNNNDNSYLHKKFKKMASTMSMLPGSSIKGEESGYQETSLLQVTSSSTITNGSIAAAHPEIEKIKDIYDKRSMDVEKNVQTNFNDENFRLSDVNSFVQIPGKTSFSEEFLNKTENLENDFIRESYSGGAGRYICPYCKISCAKPSVLQKHIRAHTNERPYPCIPCGFAFKTKSNLYKHRRSRTHALRLQGADIANAINDDDLSGDSESDTSIPPTSLSGSDRDQSSDTSMIRSERRPYEFSSPELPNELSFGNNKSLHTISNLNDNKSKAIYKPKFRAAFYHGMDEKDKIKKTISQNADFLTEHISKIISDNEAIVDVIETPLQKKYGKIKQIAESKQFLNDMEIPPELAPLNLTKTCYDTDSLVRKRSHSESFAQILEDQKHPLNPEGSIIKDLLLKTKANGLNHATTELVDGLGPLYICPVCQIVYRSADNLEVHRLYYCKGALSNNSTEVNCPQKEIKSARPENIFVRSNSINVRLPEKVMTPVSRINISTKSPPLKNKPDNLVILKPDCNDIIAPLPSPGPLLGNTRLVDSRLPSEFNKKTETLKIRPKESSPKRRLDSRSETYSPRLLDNSSPRSTDLYSQSKMRCMEINASALRSMEEMSPHIRHNSTSLQMFGGEVKIVDHSGSTTTLRIEPSKTQLSPILIHQNLSPSKYANDLEASSVVVRSGLHSGGTIVHNPPTPKDTANTSQIQATRIAVSTPTAQNLLSIHDITHFQFPPLSAITAYNPLTLPPLSPSSSPNGATTIFHGGKLIPHVPGIPGPNTPGLLVGNKSPQMKNNETLNNATKSENISDSLTFSVHNRKGSTNYDRVFNSKSPNTKSSSNELERHNQNNNYNAELQSISTVPIIKIKHVDEPVATSFPANNNIRVALRTEGVKRNAEGFPRMPVLKENSNYLFIKSKIKDSNIPSKNAENKPENEIKNFNFENLITKVEIYNNQIQSSSEVQKNCNTSETCATSLQNERSETSYFQKNLAAKTLSDERKPKFLRPSTLPLKPGTFTPKKHHGITPNANTMPLISPETPRPAKAYGQLYLNGNAYTYLGLKCSTKVFYCTINRPQPTYVPNQHFLSMYSNWQLLSELTPDPLGLSASSAMSLYDSRHRPQNVAVAVIKQDLILTHSSQWNKNSKDNKQIIPFMDTKRSEELRNIAENIATSKKEVTGGFESNEEYTYVRGRGRGRYVCSECGIRCKKPSMLKKHIRTHTDVRPYTCVHCVFRHFSFKTKGNLTKHMKSKAHYKKCCELGINPHEGNDGEGVEMAQCSGETDDETDSEGDEGNEGETESSDTEICKSRLPEHEAAHCLLSLGGSRPATSTTPGLITSARPTTYPYTPISLESEADNTLEKVPTIGTTMADSSMDVDNEPMDLSKNELRAPNNVPEIPTARESSVLASLASNTAKLPQHQSQWVNGEPMLHTYLTERALLDSKIKQSQLTCNPKTRKIDLETSMFSNKDGYEKGYKKPLNTFTIKISTNDMINRVSVTKNDTVIEEISQSSMMTHNSENITKSASTPNSENAKYIEYSKHARIKHMKTFDSSLDNHSDISSDESNGSKIYVEEKARTDEPPEVNEIKPPPSEFDSGSSNVGTEGTDFDGTSYTPEKLMEDDRRVCFFCNETFTKPPRPFRCSICAVSFRTRGHLMVHERSASHNIKISMAPNSENAKHVVSEYLKHSRIDPGKSLDDVQNNSDILNDENDGNKMPSEEKLRMDIEPMASKDITEAKDFEIIDEWKDCDFCNKMFREPAQLKLHLNIHYMERPFRCSVCAVSNRTKGYLQKNDRSAYHSDKATKKPNSENAKYVVSEYLKHARINPIKTLDDPLQNHSDITSDDSNASKVPLEEKTRTDDSSEGDGIKLPPTEYDSVAPKVVIGVGGVAFKVTKGKDFEGTSYAPGKLMEDGRRVCDFCNKTFTKPSQLRLHLNIHYMERPFRCSVCAVSFRTRGHLQKHERSASHHNKVSMTSTFGAATSFNPRPFRCSDCNIAFRIHGHLAKHLRSKMHVMRLECLFKLPFGTFTEIERAGLSLTDIDTTDCASSLASLQSLARKLHEKDPTKLEYREPSGSLPALPPTGRDSSEDEDSGVITEKTCESVNDCAIKTIENNKGHDAELRVNYSATDN